MQPSPVPIRLTDSDLDIVIRAAAPLDPSARDAFLQAVAAELSKVDVVGPGAVYLVCRAMQRQFYRPPLATEIAGHRSKYADA